MNAALCLAAVVAAHAAGVAGFYFHVNYGDERCFYENVPQTAMLSVNYDLQNEEARSCMVIISDPGKKTLQTTNLKELPMQGRVTYVVKEEGVYHVCVYCPGQMWYLSQMAKVALSLEVADGSDKYGRNTQYDVDKNTTAKRDEMKTLSEDLSKFAASIMNIKNHQRLENVTAQDLYDAYKAMHRYILYFYLLQFLIIGATAGLSVYHITKFFKAYRIV